MSERWEYKIVYVDALRWTNTGLPSELNEDFDRLGAEGWELVSIESITRRTLFGGNQTAGLVAIFKKSLATHPSRKAGGNESGGLGQ
jgi:hypothetical protein